MSPTARIGAFGSAALAVVAGGLCLALIDGLTVQVIGIALITFGLGAVVLLLFYEVGLSEDHERARDERGRAPTAERPPPRRPRLRRLPRRRG